MDLQRWERLKSDVDKAKRESDRARGTLDAMLERLKNEFDCDDEEEGKELLKKLTDDLAEAESKFKKSLGDFERKWGERLEDE